MNKQSILRLNSIDKISVNSILVRIYKGENSEKINIWQYQPDCGNFVFKNFKPINLFGQPHYCNMDFCIKDIHKWCTKHYYDVYLYETLEQFKLNFPEYFI